MEGVWKIQYPKRGYKKIFILERGPEIFLSFKASKIRGGGQAIRFHPIVAQFSS